MKRIHEFSKDQSVDSQAIIDVLKRAGLPASKCTPSSTISEEWQHRLLPLCDRLRDQQRRAQEKAQAAQATVTKKKVAAAAAPAAAAVPAAKAKTSSSARHPKVTAPEPKRWTDEDVGGEEQHHELDAWVPKEAPPPREKKSRRLTAVRDHADDGRDHMDERPSRLGAAAPALKAALETPGLEAPPPPPLVRVPEPIREPAPAALMQTAPSAPSIAPAASAPAAANAGSAAAARPAPVIIHPRTPEATLPLTPKGAQAPVHAAPSAAGAASTAAPRGPSFGVEAAKAVSGDRAAPPADRRDREERDRKDREEKERKEREEREERDRKERERREKELSPAARAVLQALEAKKTAGAAAPAAGATAPAARTKTSPASVEEEEEAAPAETVGTLGPPITEDEEGPAPVVGDIPEKELKRIVPIVRKDKRPVTPAAGGPSRPGGPGGARPGGYTPYGGQSAANQQMLNRGRPGNKRFFPMAGGGRSGMRGPSPKQQFTRPEKVTLTPPITVKDFSQATGVKVPDLIAKLLKKGKMMRITDILPEALAIELGIELNVEVDIKKEKIAEEELVQIATDVDRPEDLVTRAPVITILGHVDHGKTTLLDRIRKTNVAAGEAGGITQHIGAYKVNLPDGRAVAFVDTPGHEAFTEMRARGANVTDVVVLVVAADDGVMPQTEEAHNHAKAAGVPIVVALNKIDKPSANPMRVKQQLMGLGLQAVEWGGETEVIEVSGLTGKGIEDLLTTLSLQSDILDLKANPKKPARGTCLEAAKTEGRGIIARLMVQDGTLKRSDLIVCGSGYGKVRAIYDDKGRQLAEAGPSTPVEVIGLDEMPEAGAKFYVLDDLAKAKEIAEQRQQRRRLSALATRPAHTKLEDLFKTGAKEVRIVLKTDVKGSVEVLTKAINDLSTDEVKVRLLHSGVGGITESDVVLADASDAIIVGFSVVADEKAKAVAEQKGIDIRTYRIIYQITDDIKKAMEGLLEPEEREVTVGTVEVRKLFKASSIGTIAGCMVVKGKIERTNKVKVIRDGVIKYVGDLSSLKRFKDDAKEVREGFECGITVKNYQDLNEGDRLEAFMVEKIARTLS